MFAANDNLAQQAINALDAAGVGPVPLSGQDATAAGIQQIILGKQTMTVYKPFPEEATVAAKVALALCAGEDFQEVATGTSPTSNRRCQRDDHRDRRRTASRPTRPTGEGIVPTWR